MCKIWFKLKSTQCEKQLKPAGAATSATRGVHGTEAGTSGSARALRSLMQSTIRSLGSQYMVNRQSTCSQNAVNQINMQSADNQLPGPNTVSMMISAHRVEPVKATYYNSVTII